MPRGDWLTRLIGHNSMFCMRMIPLLAAPILTALIVALRAEAHHFTQGLAGALAGAASAKGIAALLSTPRTAQMISPLFVATWYPLATLICMGVGALAGRRFLAW